VYAYIFTYLSTGSRNPRHNFDARFRRRIFEVVHRHEKLAEESGVEFRPMSRISGACVRVAIEIKTVLLHVFPVLEADIQCIQYNKLYQY